MPAKYEWKVGRNGTRKYVRTVVVAEPFKQEVVSSEGTGEPMVGIEAPADGTMVEIVAEPAKRGPGRPKKAAPVKVVDDE